MATCSICGTTILDGNEVLLTPKEKKAPPIVVCMSCKNQADHLFDQETEDANLAAGIALGLLAGLVGSLIWYAIVVLTEYQLGIVAVGVGALVGFAVMWGAGRKRGRKLQIASLVIALLAMVFSEYLIIRHYVVLYLAEEGTTGIPLLLPPLLVIELLIEGIKSSPIDLLFWAYALWQAYKIPGKRSLRTAPVKQAAAG